MSPVSQVAADYLETLLAGQSALPAGTVTWLNALRKEALERSSQLSLPTTRDEEWRFTDISPLFRMPFHPVQAPPRLQLGDIEPFVVPEAPIRLVFVDGHFVPRLSVMAAAGSRVVVSDFASGMAACGDIMGRHLGRLADFRSNAFAAINTAFLHDGAMIHLPPGAAESAPVHVLFISAGKGVASYPRCLILGGAGSTMTVIEDHVSLHDEAGFVNAVSEIFLEDHARLNHIRVQRENGHAFHIAHCSASLARGSRYESVQVALGARISRYNLEVLHAEEGAVSSVDGLALISGTRLADTHTCITHSKPHGTSRQLHKCIAGGSAHGVFNGKIKVQPGAQRTDSQQTSRNLLLSARAHVDIKPQLEIFADDVKCTHGAAVGQLDSEEVFYLQSRGFSSDAARNLLTYAFGAEIIERIPVASLRHTLEQAVLQQTSGQV